MTATRAGLLPVLAALAACGGSPTPAQTDDARVSTDAPAGPDAPWPIDAAPPTQVRVTSLSGDGSPDPAAIVVYPDLGGGLQSTTSSAAGTASVNVPYHATITVLQERAGSGGVLEDHYTTFVATEFDDDLNVGAPPRIGANSGNPIAMTARLPDDHAGAALYSECGAVSPANGSATLTLYDSCGATPFGVLAVDGSAAPPAFEWQPGEAVTAGGQIAMPDAFRVFDPLAVSLANIPAGLTRLEVSDAIVLGAISALPVPLDDQTRASPAAGSATLALRYPLGAGDETFVLVRELTGGDELRDVVSATTTSSTDLAIDLAAQALPAVDLPTRTARGLAWTETPAGSPGAARVRFVTWRATWHDAAGVEHDLTWLVVDDPAHPPAMTLPALPAELAAYDPFAADDLALGTYQVEYVAHSGVGSYRAARRVGEALADITVPVPADTYTAAASRSPAP